MPAKPAPESRADQPPNLKPTPKPPGPAPALSPSDLDRLAEVTGADVDAAAGYWGRLAPDEFKGMATARPDKAKGR